MWPMTTGTETNYAREKAFLALFLDIYLPIGYIFYYKETLKIIVKLAIFKNNKYFVRQ